MGQHPPVMSSCLWGIQAATELLPDRRRDAECAGSCHGGDGARWVQQRQIDASRFLEFRNRNNTVLFPKTKQSPLTQSSAKCLALSNKKRISTIILLVSMASSWAQAVAG